VVVAVYWRVIRVDRGTRGTDNPGRANKGTLRYQSELGICLSSAAVDDFLRAPNRVWRCWRAGFRRWFLAMGGANPRAALAKLKFRDLHDRFPAFAEHAIPMFLLMGQILRHSLA